jgi:hypothetical protein
LPLRFRLRRGCRWRSPEAGDPHRSLPFWKVGAVDRPVIVSTPMQPSLNPDVADLAPTDPALTEYDEQHVITYLRMLDANADGADWREVSRIVLHIDAEREPDRARRAFDSHLARARWMSGVGYRHLLRYDG